ncbi:MAG: radical SAM protein [Anaerolineae bacterium]|nr:radical SAM protein [Anaerolineae bacterium]
MDALDKRHLYRMPWSMNDNPIGWLESTDRCNIACLGCYRRTIAGHKPLEEIKQDVLFLKQWRNAHNISIAGGEPLIHPDLPEIVRFIREQGMEPLILTNGRALTREMLLELKKAGAMGIAFHVDSLQKREPKWNNKTELELNELREELMELVASVPGMYCNFGMTVYRSNLEQIPDVLRWANRHIDKVHGLVLITFRAAGLDTSVEYWTPDGGSVSPEELGYAAHREVLEDAGVTGPELWALLRREFPHYDAAAYLGGTQRHDSIKWLIGVQIGLGDGTMLGSVGPRLSEAFEVWHHWVHGTYVAHRPSNRIGPKIFLTSVFDEKVRAAWGAFWRGVVARPARLFKPVYLQALGIIQAPDLLPDGRTDMCDSCPDMCVHEGTLVHSCRWDEWRLYGGYLSPHLQQSTPESEPARELAHH